MTRAFRMTSMCPSRATSAGRRTPATRWWSSCANGNRVTPIPKAKSSRCSARPDEEGVDMLSVLRQYDLPLHFPKHVLHEARPSGRRSPPAIWPAARIAGTTQVVTIDPDDAKDFDDAICLQRVVAGSMEALGAHRRRVALREARHALDDEAPQARQLDLPGGPRHPDAARGVEQRTVLAQARGGSPDQVRGVPGVERRSGAEHASSTRR